MSQRAVSLARKRVGEELKRLVVVLTAVMLTSCASHKVADQLVMDESCKANGYCSVTGRLKIISSMYGRVGVMRSPGDCVDIALPNYIYADAAIWNDSIVKVTGRMYLREDEPTLLSYNLLDREVIVAECGSGKVLYAEVVDSLEE